MSSVKLTANKAERRLVWAPFYVLHFVRKSKSK